LKQIFETVLTNLKERIFPLRLELSGVDPKATFVLLGGTSDIRAFPCRVWQQKRDDPHFSRTASEPKLRTYPSRHRDKQAYLSSRMGGSQMAKQSAIRDDGFRLSDELWGQMEPLLLARPAHPLGCHRPRMPDRTVMNAIFFVLRTGCQWNALNATGIWSSSSAHRRFQEWTEAGVFEAFWQAGLLAYDGLEGIDWKWLALDGAMGKAPPRRGEKPVPTQRIGPSAGPSAACSPTRAARRSPLSWLAPTATTTP